MYRDTTNVEPEMCDYTSNYYYYFRFEISIGRPFCKPLDAATRGRSRLCSPSYASAVHLSLSSVNGNCCASFSEN